MNKTASGLKATEPDTYLVQTSGIKMGDVAAPSLKYLSLLSIRFRLVEP